MKSVHRAAWAALLWLLPTPLQAEGSLAWDEAFPTAAAPRTVYFRADYRDGFGNGHQLQVWRDSDRRLRRRTDARIDLLVERNDDGEYGYRVLDHAQGTVIRADRTVLYRIGIFSDWRGLAHVLDRPRGPYRIARADPEAASMPQGRCDWYRLDVNSPSQAARVCWSMHWGVPLAIEAPTSEGGWTRQFTVEDIREFEPDSRIFDVPQDGLLQVDADPGGDSVD
jgi:hypothetical protein